MDLLLCHSNETDFRASNEKYTVDRAGQSLVALGARDLLCLTARCEIKIRREELMDQHKTNTGGAT